MKGRFIKVHNLLVESSLTGSLVLVYFELKCYAIKSKKTDNIMIAGNTFGAILTQVKVLVEPGTERR